MERSFANLILMIFSIFVARMFSILLVSLIISIIVIYDLFKTMGKFRRLLSVLFQLLSLLLFKRLKFITYFLTTPISFI